MCGCDKDVQEIRRNVSDLAPTDREQRHRSGSTSLRINEATNRTSLTTELRRIKWRFHVSCCGVNMTQREWRARAKIAAQAGAQHDKPTSTAVPFNSTRVAAMTKRASHVCSNRRSKSSEKRRRNEARPRQAMSERTVGANLDGSVGGAHTDSCQKDGSKMAHTSAGQDSIRFSGYLTTTCSSRQRAHSPHQRMGMTPYRRHQNRRQRTERRRRKREIAEYTKWMRSECADVAFGPVRWSARAAHGPQANRHRRSGSRM